MRILSVVSIYACRQLICDQGSVQEDTTEKYQFIELFVDSLSFNFLYFGTNLIILYHPYYFSSLWITSSNIIIIWHIFHIADTWHMTVPNMPGFYIHSVRLFLKLWRNLLNLFCGPPWVRSTLILWRHCEAQAKTFRTSHPAWQLGDKWLCYGFVEVFKTPNQRQISKIHNFAIFDLIAMYV